MTTLYHCSPSENRESILSEGLRKSHPNAATAQRGAVPTRCPGNPIIGLHQIPAGVYCWTKLFIAKNWGSMCKFTHQHRASTKWVAYDVWEITIPDEQQHLLVPDACELCSWHPPDKLVLCYPDSIPPEWITLHSKMESETDSALGTGFSLFRKVVYGR